MSWKRFNVGNQPCHKDCPERKYEAKKQEIYAIRLAKQQTYDYTSPMARQVAKRRVTDYKQGRNYR